MRKASMIVVRIISLCLAFVLGFFSAFGAVAGGIYLAYSKVSIDKINEWGEKFGFYLPTDDYVDQEAEKPITSLTIQELLAEMQGLGKSKLTLDQMINRYGLIVPSDVTDKIPNSIMNDIPFASLFTKEGIDAAMNTVTVTEILDLIPKDIAATIISDPTRDELSDNTLADIVKMDMGHIFDGIQLGYITMVNYEKDENGVYQIVMADPSNPTLLELVAPLDLGGILKAVTKKEGNVLEVVEKSIGDVVITSLLGTSMKDITALSNLLGNATIGDMIVQDPVTGEFTLDVMAAMEGKKVGSLLGYEETEIPDESGSTSTVWKDTDGKEVKGINAKIADYALTDLIEGKISTNTLLDGLTVADILGYEKRDLPIYLNDTALEGTITVWYQEKGEPVDKIMGAFAGMAFDDISTISSSLHLYDILGYYEHDDEWYTWEVEGEKVVLTATSGIMAEIADTPVGDLSSIEVKLKDMKIGDLLGYTPEYEKDGKGNYITDAKGNKIVDYWKDSNGKVTGVTASLSDLTINELSDGNTLQNTINDMRIADVMGYTEKEDGWYQGESKVTGVMAALAESKVSDLSTDINNMQIGKMLGYTPVYTTDSEGNQIIDHWVDSNNDQVTGIMASFAGLSVDDMSDNNKVQAAIQDIKVADVMGLKQDEHGIWRDSDDNQASGIMSAIADTKVGDLSDKMNTIMIGEMLGHTPVYKKDGEGNKIIDHWVDSNGNEVTGIVGVLADTTVADLNSRLNNVTVGEVLGFKKETTTDKNGNEVTIWYDGKDDEGNDKPASGVTGALANTKLNELNSALNSLKIGEVAGYTPVYKKDSNGNYVNSEGTIVTEKDRVIDHWEVSEGVPATGIMAQLADLTVDQLTNNDTLTDKIGNVTLADTLGYKKNESGNWCDKSGEQLTGIMAALADKPINQMNTAVNELTLNDVIPGEKTGLLSIVGGSTKITEINGAIDNSIKTTPLQFFIDNELITLEDSTQSALDVASQTKGDKVQITGISEDGKYGTITDKDDKGNDKSSYDKYNLDSSYIIKEGSNYYVPTWRTKPLQEAFGYVVKLLTSTSTS